MTARRQIPDAHASFTDLGVPALLADALAAQNITRPFPVQAATLPDALAGRDILGKGRTGSGKTYTKAELLAEARSGQLVYEHQEDAEQAVRVWDDTAVVTAKLWEKGTKNGEPFDYTLWFSDTYVRTSTGWRYVFGQASLPLPNRKK